MSPASADETAPPQKEADKSAVARSINMSGNSIESRDLFSSEREIMIVHGDETYRLRLTSQNKLILTK